MCTIKTSPKKQVGDAPGTPRLERRRVHTGRGKKITKGLSTVCMSTDYFKAGSFLLFFPCFSFVPAFRNL